MTKHGIAPRIYRTPGLAVLAAVALIALVLFLANGGGAAPHTLAAGGPGACPAFFSAPNAAVPVDGCDEEESVATHKFKITNPSLPPPLPGLELTCVVTGPTQIAKSAVGDSDADGLDDVLTELTFMKLTGRCDPGNIPVTMTAGPPLPPSFGRIEEKVNNTPKLDCTAGNPGICESFFDVFIEIDTPAPLGVLHNNVAARMQCQIGAIPPIECDYELKVPPNIDMFNEEEKKIGELTEASHQLVENVVVLEGPLRVVQDKTGVASSLQAVFTGTGGTLTKPVVTVNPPQCPAPSISVVGGNTVVIDWGEKCVKKNDKVQFRVFSEVAEGIVLASRTWKNSGDALTVGGISAGGDLRALPLETTGSGTDAGLLAGAIAGSSALALTLVGAGWYARRRWLR